MAARVRPAAKLSKTLHVHHTTHIIYTTQLQPTHTAESDDSDGAMEDLEDESAGGDASDDGGSDDEGGAAKKRKRPAAKGKVRCTCVCWGRGGWQ